MLDELIGNVRMLKGGQQNIGGELTEQEKLINVNHCRCRFLMIKWTITSNICLQPEEDSQNFFNLVVTAVLSL